MLYGFAVDDGPVLPDPRSRRQPDGPDGLSAVVDQARTRGARSGRGSPLPGAVLYELHVGMYTPEGNSTRPPDVWSTSRNWVSPTSS